MLQMVRLGFRRAAALVEVISGQERSLLSSLGLDAQFKVGGWCWFLMSRGHDIILISK